MSKKLFKVVCTKEVVIYVAADTPEIAEKRAEQNHDQWENDDFFPWDTAAFEARPGLSDGWDEKCLCYGAHVNRYLSRKSQTFQDVTCQQVMDGKLK